MSLSEMRAVLRFAPVYDPRILEVPGLARDLMVQPGALETVGLDEATPVVIDHDMDRQVGTVREIYIAPSVDAGHVPEWFYASCDSRRPSRLAQGRRRGLVEPHSAPNAGCQRDDPPPARGHQGDQHPDSVDPPG